MELYNMKWFKPYECDNTVKNPFVCDYSNINKYGFSKWDLLKGEAIKSLDDTILFQSKKKKNNDESRNTLYCYADTCCLNHPFDDQGSLSAIRL